MRHEALEQYVAIDCTVKRMTRRAVLIEYGDREAWVPMSCIHADDLAEIDEGVIGEVRVVDWFYYREGL